MAAAYRAVDRIHSPLVSPLEDLNPTTAHLKAHWPSSLHRLQACTLGSAFRSGTDYSKNGIYHGASRFQADELLILNIYKTNGASTAYGLGPSPLSPLYIFYSTLHPADHLLPPPPSGSKATRAKFKSLFKPEKKPDHLKNEYGKVLRPNLIQSFLDRRDFTSLSNTTVACMRFHEEYVGWRLAVPPYEKRWKEASSGTEHAEGSGKGIERFGTFPRSNSVSGVLKRPVSMGNLHRPAKGKGKAKDSEPQEATDPDAGQGPGLPKDIPAAKVYLMPTIKEVEQRREKSLSELFSSRGEPTYQIPMYTTLEELSGAADNALDVYFSDTGRTKTYWWIWEHTSWRIVFDERDDVTLSSKRRRRVPTENRKSFDSDEAQTPVLKNLFRRPKIQQKVADMFPEVNGGVVKLYMGDSTDPVGYVELLSGQMWIVKYILLKSIDIVITITFAVVNLERSVRAEHDKERDKWGRFSSFQN